MSKYLVVFGTRPEAIKMAPVLRALAHQPKVTSVACCTGQHDELLTPVLSLFQITPQYNLRVMSQNQQLCGLTALLLTELEKVMKAERPDWVLVQGDTTTAMVAAMAAAYLKIPVAHIEAGLRSHNPLEPFPEELNRKMIDIVADLFFAPTAVERTDLLREGKSAEKIYITGNTSIDALRHVASLPFSVEGTALAVLPAEYKRIILATVHRRENHGQPLQNICQAIRLIANQYRDEAHVIIPVHPNPNVRACVHRLLGDVPNISLTAPLGYQELIWVAKSSYFALTDSGGLSEELTWLGKPALILRNVTDRREAVDAGAAMLVGTEMETIVSRAIQLMEDDTLYHRMAKPRELFGDGTAAQQIVNILEHGESWIPVGAAKAAGIPNVSALRPAA